MTSTGHDRRLYNQDRSLPTTLYTFYTIMHSPQNTLKIHGRVLWHLPVTTDGFIIKTGQAPPPPPPPVTADDFIHVLPSWVKSLRIHWKYTVVYYDIYHFINVPHKCFARALPTVRIIVPSSPMVSVWPNTTAQTITERYMVVGHSLVERVTIISYLADQEHNWILHVIHFKFVRICTYIHTKGPSAS